MPKFIVEFRTENAAFGYTKEERNAEILRILKEIARGIEDKNKISGTIVDSNGNSIGRHGMM
jgi:hypothetical protein